MKEASLRLPRIADTFRIPIFSGAEPLRERLYAEVGANGARLPVRTPEFVAKSAERVPVLPAFLVARVGTRQDRD